VFEYHHLGIPTTVPRRDERYVPRFKMHVSGYSDSEFRIQWHRFDDDCELPELIQTVPHVAFRVIDLEAAIAGRRVIHPINEPLPGFYVAFIEDGGAPIELLQTDLDDDAIIDRAEAQSIRPS
jgi:hypothetical protein